MILGVQLSLTTLALLLAYDAGEQAAAGTLRSAVELMASFAIVHVLDVARHERNEERRKKHETP